MKRIFSKVLLFLVLFYILYASNVFFLSIFSIFIILFNPYYIFIIIFFSFNYEITLIITSISIITLLVKKLVTYNKKILYFYIITICLLANISLLFINSDYSFNFNNIDYLLNTLYFISGSIILLGIIYCLEINYSSKQKLYIRKYNLFTNLFILLLLEGIYSFDYYLIFILIIVIYLNLKLDYTYSYLISSVSIYFPFGYILPFFSLLLHKIPYSFIITLVFLLLNIYIFNLFPDYITFYLLIGILFYPIFHFVLNTLITRNVKSESNLKDTSKNLFPIHKNLINNFNNQILKFASFLESFSRNFVGSPEHKRKFSDSFQEIVDSFCSRCEKKVECFKDSRNQTYEFIKNTLLYGNELYYKKSSNEVLNYVNTCLYAKDLILKSNSLKNKHNLNCTKNIKEKNLETQITGFCTTIRQYALDITSKDFIEEMYIYNLKNSFIERGYKILLFNIKKSYINDFLIEIGIENLKKDEIQMITSICELELNLKCSIFLNDYNKFSKTDTYFSIIPKIKFNILYGHGSLSKNNLLITGDNYMVKDLSSGNFVTCLSDGMGSGYKAYSESKKTLKLIDQFIEFNMNMETSINMLNTFYSLKESIDTYATLDLIEINRSTGNTLLYKLGSADTYIYRDGKLRIYNNVNLPFGVNDMINKETFYVKDNDLIILMSDGITDNITHSLLDKIVSISLNKHPQKIVHEILNSLLLSNNNITKDDMSLVILKVEKE